MLRRSLDISKLKGYRDHFEEQMKNHFVVFNLLDKKVRLWNTSLFIMPRFENLSCVGKLDKLGFQVSTGSACSTTKVGASPIAQALSLSDTKPND